MEDLRRNSEQILSSAGPVSIAAVGREYTNDENDRHLLATCVEHGIPTLITEDKGFNADACAEGLGVEIVTTDEFLEATWKNKLDNAVAAIGDLLSEFAGQYDLAKPLFERCPRFEALVRARFGLPPLG